MRPWPLGARNSPHISCRTYIVVWDDRRVRDIEEGVELPLEETFALPSEELHWKALSGWGNRIGRRYIASLECLQRQELFHNICPSIVGRESIVWPVAHLCRLSFRRLGQTWLLVHYWYCHNVCYRWCDALYGCMKSIRFARLPGSEYRRQVGYLQDHRSRVAIVHRLDDASFGVGKRR